MRKVEVLGKRRVYEGFSSVDEVEVRWEDLQGKLTEPVKRESVERGDAVAVLVRHVEKNQFLFVRQLRVPLIRHDEPWLLEIVAGMVDEGERPEQSARREVEEETGYKVWTLEPVTEMYGSPGGLSEKVWIYYAEIGENDRVGEGGGTDEHEDVEMVWMPLQEAYDALDRTTMRDAKTQIALWKVRSRFMP